MKRLVCPWRRLARGEAGATSVEFAIVALAAIVAIVGVIEFGRAIELRAQMAQAADVGVRRVLLDSTHEVSDLAIQDAVRDAFHRGNAQNLVVAVETEIINGRPYRTLRATYPFSLSIPGLARPIDLTVVRRTPVL